MCTRCDSDDEVPTNEPVEPQPTPEVEPEDEPEEEPEEEPAIQRADCNTTLEGEPQHMNIDAQPICESCDMSYGSCDRCGNRYHEDDAVTVDGETWCERCSDRHAIACSDCGDRFNANSNGVTLQSGEWICDSCYSNGDYFTCDGCSESYGQDDYGSDGFCCNCDEDRNDSAIKEYSDKTADRMGPFGKGPVWFGVELEVEVPDGDPAERAQAAIDRMGDDFIVCKKDGSIDNGFEIVTAPASVEEHRKRWTMLLQRSLFGCRSWDTKTCGMHVHVSRCPLGHLTIGKILVFINARENLGFMTEIAGRTSERWALMYPKKVSDARLHHDRYNAVNLCNYNTIEFRIFKGSLKLQTVLKNIEFVHATVEFCKQAGMNGLHYRDFIRYVGRTPKMWPNLSAWMRDHGHLPRIKTKPNTTEQQPQVEV